VSKTRVRLADIHLYVFCQEYRQQNQRINRSGAFEIRFVSEEGKLSILLRTVQRLTHTQRPNVLKNCSPLRLRTIAQRQTQRPEMERQSLFSTWTKTNVTLRPCEFDTSPVAISIAF